MQCHDTAKRRKSNFIVWKHWVEGFLHLAWYCIVTNHPYISFHFFPILWIFLSDTKMFLLKNIFSNIVKSILISLFFLSIVVLGFSLTVKAVTLILISGRGLAISSAKQGKSGSIYYLVNN